MDPHKLRPRRDWALVLQDQRKKKTATGLIIPEETTHEKLHEGAGTIIAVGTGPLQEAEELQAGDRVMYRTYLRHALKVEVDETWPDGEKKEYFLVAVADLAAVLWPGVEVGLLSERKDQ